MNKKFDKRDYITLVLIALTIALIIWAGLRAGSCVRAMNVYNEGGEWMCAFCDELIGGGILRK